MSNLGQQVEAVFIPEHSDDSSLSRQRHSADMAEPDSISNNASDRGRSCVIHLACGFSHTAGSLHAIACCATAAVGTLCVSSQVGCTLKCLFCRTGAMDKKNLRNLKPEEIVGQVMLAKHAVGDFRHRSSSSNPSLNNVVMMGMLLLLLRLGNVLTWP